MDVSVRPATADDLTGLTTVLDLPERAAERLLYERTTTIAEAGDELIAGLAYDLWADSVHITHLGGDPDAIPALLEEPRALAARRGHPVEIIVPTDDALTVDTLETAGFEDVGSGPAFHGQTTRRYHLAPD